MSLRNLERALRLFLIIPLIGLVGCNNPIATQLTATSTQTIAPPTATASITPSPTLTPTVTLTPLPPELPEGFISPDLNPLDYPHTYIKDTCTYLKLKWDPNNSVPGTIVMPIMIHSIIKGEATDPEDISGERFEILARDLHGQNFSSITMEELWNFLDHNAKIPQRSFIFIVDDNRMPENYITWFRPLYEQYGWTVTNAIISDSRSDDFWNGHIALEQEGWLDHQAHGVLHNINITPYSTDDFIKSEIYGSIQGIQLHFNKTPIAYIWPGGGFTERGVQIAGEAGFKLGFTTLPRGPVMFNWIPLADVRDPNREFFTPEGTLSNVLLVLPRFWSSDADFKIDLVRVIGQQAAAFAESNRQTELDYYNIVCVPVTGAIPPLNP
jgi:hypothetical protein